MQIQVCYQGADYEDPVQPTKEEIEEKIKLVEKDRKKQKNAPPLNVEEFYKPRMITPPPVLDPLPLSSNSCFAVDVCNYGFWP